MRTIAISFALACLGCSGDSPSNPGIDAAEADASTTIDGPAVTTFSFFISSAGNPNGGNFGGITGADEFCRLKAVAAVPASGSKTWHAYLSTATEDAKDRIGTGPRFNKNGVMVATTVANLHDAAANNVNKTTAIDENGATVNGAGDTPNQHDIVTGSNADGTKTANTCNNWTSAAATGVIANVGHHDRMGGGAAPTSWNAAHASNGCSAQAFVNTGGRGSIFCFATN
jgi:Protein of unknown function (DUF1554)